MFLVMVFLVSDCGSKSMPPLSQNFDRHMVEGAQRSFLRAAVTAFRTCHVVGLDGSMENLTSTMDGMVLHLEHVQEGIDRVAKKGSSLPDGG